MRPAFDDARRILGVLIARLEPQPETTLLHLVCPRVGLWRAAPRVGHAIVPHQGLGELEVLGRRYRLQAPEGALGRVVAVTDPGSARKAMQWGGTLLVIDSASMGLGASETTNESARADAGGAGEWLRSPSSGRFYCRPTPDQPAFIAPGDEIETGDTFVLLEVMKTFTRLQFQGPELPDRALVAEIAVADGDEVDFDTPLMRWQALD